MLTTTEVGSSIADSDFDWEIRSAGYASKHATDRT